VADWEALAGALMGLVASQEGLEMGEQAERTPIPALPKEIEAHKLASAGQMRIFNVALNYEI